jgi:hypothetical protein
VVAVASRSSVGPRGPVGGGRKLNNKDLQTRVREGKNSLGEKSEGEEAEYGITRRALTGGGRRGGRSSLARGRAAALPAVAAKARGWEGDEAGI